MLARGLRVRVRECALDEFGETLRVDDLVQRTELVRAEPRRRDDRLDARIDHDGVELVGRGDEVRALVLPDEPLLPRELDVALTDAGPDIQIAPSDLLVQLPTGGNLEGLALIQAAPWSHPERIAMGRNEMKHQHSPGGSKDKQPSREAVDLLHVLTVDVRVEPERGLEPLTPSLPWRCSAD